MAGEKKTNKPSIHTGHRQRAKAEFLSGRGLEGLPDHRALELLLFYAIPQGDVNPLAHRLVDEFGSLAGVFNATTEQLLAVKGMGPNSAALIRLVMGLYRRYLEEQGSFEGQVVSVGQLERMLRPMFFGARDELAFLVCMDGKNKVLACKKLGEGMVSAVHITVRKVMEAALACNAARVILAHNHVSGIAMPSEADIATTRRLRSLLAEAGVELLDHLVFGDGEAVSMAESGLLSPDLGD